MKEDLLLRRARHAAKRMEEKFGLNITPFTIQCLAGDIKTIGNNHRPIAYKRLTEGNLEWVADQGQSCRIYLWQPTEAWQDGDVWGWTGKPHKLDIDIYVAYSKKLQQVKTFLHRDDYARVIVEGGRRKKDGTVMVQMKELKLRKENYKRRQRGIEG